jgi:RNase P protein component
VDEVSLKIHAVEEERYRCEVRQILRWRAEDREKAMEFLTNVRKRRGDITAEKLAKDCKEQWSRGNKGIEGDWRE